jgi:hypothetical protein
MTKQKAALATSAERGRFAGFDTWDEFIEAQLREFNNRPKQRRLAETERIVADWHRGGYALFCELMERANLASEKRSGAKFNEKVTRLGEQKTKVYSLHLYRARFTRNANSVFHLARFMLVTQRNS